MQCVRLDLVTCAIREGSEPLMGSGIAWRAICTSCGSAVVLFWFVAPVPNHRLFNNHLIIIKY